ncbi:MAG: hypothetical protein LBC74_09590, partial [Planctomycetaceae bacterium]|jgi:hypothetical protein|nr:hypothetical protein [Planctomycetaceae bacterium]
MELDALFSCYQNNRIAFDSEFRKKMKILLGEDEKDYLRHERYIDYSVTYFYYCITKDRRIFLMYLRRHIRAFLGENKRCVIKVIVNVIKKFQTKFKTSKSTNNNNNI